jgi:uncharacterized membrane protein
MKSEFIPVPVPESKQYMPGQVVEIVLYPLYFGDKRAWLVTPD